MSLQVAIAIALGVAAVVEDLRSRRIPNWIPIAALLAGFISQTLAHGWKGLLSALLGAVTGFLVFLVFYVLGGMGGGDIKLMSGLGAVIGIEHVLFAAFAAAVVGAVMAVAVIGGRALRSKRGDEGAEARSLPYAPAIAAGVWLS